MKPVRTIARLCALLLALAALGCSSEEESGPDTGGSGGSAATETKGGATGVAGAAFGGGGTGGGSVVGGSGQKVGGASAGSAGTTSGSTAGTGGTTSTVTGAGGSDTGAAGSAIGVGGSVAGGTAGAGQFHSISGTVSGLSGTGLGLSLGSGTPLSITANGAFAFPTQVASGSHVTVNVAAQPTGPRQTCTVSASGSIASLTHDVTDVAVTCTTNSYAVGGTVAGLVGSGLVIQDSAGAELAMGGNGRFAFPTRLLSGQPFTVTVKTQPSAPAQSCSVSGGSGTIGAADVSSVTINCSTNSYTIGGTLTGLAGSGLVLRNNGSDEVLLSANGSFAFSTPVLSGSAFAVTVQTQPSAPAQTCAIVNGIGTVANGDVNSVAVNCTTTTYAVRGTVTGLVGSGLTLQNNLSDNLAVAANGAFSFSTSLASGAYYSVTVQTQPTAPTQTCTVSDANGTIVNSEISSVSVTCSTKKYSVGGTVVGLVGTGLVLRNNGGDDLTLDNDGSFAFTTSVASGEPFEVTIFAQPSGRLCSLAGGRGTIGSADIASVTVNCSDKAYIIGGTVSGLAGTGLELALNGTESLSVTANGSFAFADLAATHSVYTVTIAQQPSTPWQICALTNASGTVGTADISDVTVACTTNVYSVGGSVSGLDGSGLVLQNEGGDDLVVNADGSFAFPTRVPSGQPYAVAVRTQPTSPSQTCSVTNAGGSIGGASITNVQVTCRTNPYSIAGTIAGLAGSVVLANNDNDTLTLNANGTFAFTSTVASGDAYNVKVVDQPTTPLQICTVSNGSGTVGSANVTNVRVVCTTSQFAIGGTVTGLASGQQIVLQNNAGDDLAVTADGTFSFLTPIASGSAYAVTVLTNPSEQVCTVSGSTGTVGGANVTSIAVNCTNLRTVGGTVTGLSGSGLVLRNGSEDMPVSGNGTFAFGTLQLDGSTYSVTVRAQPTSPWQICTIAGGTGTVSGNVTSVAVTCTSNPYRIAVNVIGLVGTGLVLQNNNADNLSVAGTGVWTFATQVQSGQPYSVKVLTQPSAPNQTCTVSAATGTVANADVTVAINCASNNYTIGGTVAGYVGNGLVLRNNGGNDLSISATGVFTFAAPVASGTNFAVTVASQPTGLTCGVSYGTGTVGSANITSIRVNCPAYTFDNNTQGWTIKNLPSGVSQPTWSSAQGYPGAGALLVTLPFTSSNCQQVDLAVPPPATLNATGTTLTAWIRFDAFPNSPASGVVQLYAQDSGWGWNAAQYQISSFQLGVWKQLTLTLPAGGNWTKVNALGIQVTPGGSSNCQTATIYVDSIQLQ